MQLGLSMDDLERVSMGMVYDMMTERGNDEYPYATLAGQEDFDRF